MYKQSKIKMLKYYKVKITKELLDKLFEIWPWDTNEVYTCENIDGTLHVV